MSRISKLKSMSSPSPKAVKGGHHPTSSSNSNITIYSIIRFYLKLLVYILIVFFIVLQYINWNHTETIVRHHASMKEAMTMKSKQSQQQQRQNQHQQQPHNGKTTKIHIVFSTGCNAFQDCTSSE